ncbi:hypothetical protein [Collimonas arenae]|uniref:hypothetical protein n=1 Tax=Collimonas arenae TaxID=279058 RepID=UPI0012E043C1|nr:hypothetical protein [Collimonas arenae]
MKQEQSPKIAQLLLGYSRLSDTEAKHFTRAMNQFIFASPLRKREMRECWERQGLSVSKIK